MGTDDDGSDLMKNDADSEAQFELLRDIAEEEILVRLSMGSRLETPADAKVVAGSIADAILDAFAVRKRPPDKPRYSALKSASTKFRGGT